MVCYITDGINYLSSSNLTNPRISKKKESGLKFPDEKSAFPVLLEFRTHLPEKARKKWHIEKTGEVWVEPEYFYLRCVRGYLTPKNEITPNRENAGVWAEDKINNLLHNQCATHPNLKKMIWDKIPVSDFSTEESSEPEPALLDIQDVSGEPDAEQESMLFPFSQEFTIHNSYDFLEAFALFYQNIEERKIKLIEECSCAERQILIVEHAIEFNEYSMEEEHRLVRLIKQLRIKRRMCKDEQVLVNGFLKQISPDILKEIQQDANRLKERYYTVRAFPELFQDSKNAIFSTAPEIPVSEGHEPSDTKETDLFCNPGTADAGTACVLQCEEESSGMPGLDSLPPEASLCTVPVDPGNPAF